MRLCIVSCLLAVRTEKIKDNSFVFGCIDVIAVTDGQLITGRGAGHAVAFGLAILSALKGKEAADKVKEGLML